MDDHVCLCFHVSRRKIVNFLNRERPEKISRISECLSAGTGCGWCIPFLDKLHRQMQNGVESPDLPMSPEEYAARRAKYRADRQRTQGTKDAPR